MSLIDKFKILLLYNTRQKKNSITCKYILMKIFNMARCNDNIYYIKNGENSAKKIIYWSQYYNNKKNNLSNKIKQKCIKNDLCKNPFSLIISVFSNIESKYHNRINRKYYYYHNDELSICYNSFAFNYNNKRMYVKMPLLLKKLTKNKYIYNDPKAKDLFYKLIGSMPY